MAALSMWSAAIGGTVKVSSRGSARPVLLWSALVAGTGRGKGTALRAALHVLDKSLGRFLATHTTSGITSGASLVNHLWEQQEATAETEHGRDVRTLVVEEEWTEVLKRVKRDPSFTTKLRAAWDGTTLRNTTKEEAQEIRDPAIVLHSHITPSDWDRYIGQSEAAGGSYNRILPFLLGSVPMLDDDRVALPQVGGPELTDAYGWATARPRVITLGEEARPLWRIVRRYARILGETLPEAQAVFIERTAEQTLRVAACLAASECAEIITEEMLSVAFSLVRRSVQDAVRISKGSDAPKVKRQPLSLADKVRARIEMHGGRATSSQVLPFVGATAAEVKALPGIVVTVERSGKTGRPATVFTLGRNTAGYADRQPASADSDQKRDASRHAVPQPASAEREEIRATVVRLDAYRPTPKQAPAPRPESVKRSEPLATTNPFMALL
ncbi:YfjI family protein [Streptomyces noursei]|uniref:YfjI family protein n=1 Tax=Streptomyces noursei TaxID=1971 RepID=UPI0021551E4A|nr:YfjI family protein [Streptomyces noursei]